MTERFDLNLFLVFDTLMRERSVSRAAARLGLGQPATSAALSRLRVLFGDPLFVRTPQGMLPTVRAEAVAMSVSAAIAQLRATLEAPTFDPATARRTFAISGIDYLGLVALPILVEGLQREAPGIDLRVRFIEKDQILEALETGQIDLAAAVLSDIPKHFAAETLLTESFVCVTRLDHPVIATGLTLDAYVDLPHLLVTQRGDASGAVDEALAARGLTRRVMVTVPQVAIVPMLLAGTNLVGTIGRRAAERLAMSNPIRLDNPPIALPNWRMDLMWSRRNDADPGLAWLRARLRAAASF